MNNRPFIPAIICSRDIGACIYGYGTTGVVDPNRSPLNFWKFFPDGGEGYALLTDQEVYFSGRYQEPPDLEQKHPTWSLNEAPEKFDYRAGITELRQRLQRLQDLWSPSGPACNTDRASAYKRALNAVDDIFGPEKNS